MRKKERERKSDRDREWRREWEGSRERREREGDRDRRRGEGERERSNQRERERERESESESELTLKRPTLYHPCLSTFVCPMFMGSWQNCLLNSTFSNQCILLYYISWWQLEIQAATHTHALHWKAYASPCCVWNATPRLFKLFKPWYIQVAFIYTTFLLDSAWTIDKTKAW